MLKKWILPAVVPVLFGFMIAQAVNAGNGAPGSSTDPVISRSYADKVLLPLKNELKSLTAELASLKQSPGGSGIPGSSGGSGGSGSPGGSGTFKDLPSTHWAYGDIMYMVDKGILKGLSPGVFGTDVPARRSELAVMLVKALGLSTSGLKAEFEDVPGDYWAGPYIAAAQKAGIISGFPGGQFKPDDNVTRGQMAVMLARAYSLRRTDTVSDFADVPESYWAYGSIMKLADNKITKGFEDQTFRPAVPVRRAEVAVFLAKAIDPSRR